MAEGWPHTNSDFVLDATERWIRRFCEWPEWLEYPGHVAADLLRMGRLTRAEIAASGYRPFKDNNA